MRAVLQRVSEASVSVEGAVVGAIGRGLLVLVCVERGDGEEQAAFFARKIAAMRIFEDAGGRMNLSVRDIGGEILAISQFTLAAEWRKGNRPSFSRAAAPEEANPLFEHLCERLRAEGLRVATGRFGARMDVRLRNDGPVTVMMD